MRAITKMNYIFEIYIVSRKKEAQQYSRPNFSFVQFVRKSELRRKVMINTKKKGGWKRKRDKKYGGCRERGIKRKEEEIFHLLVNFPNGPNSQGLLAGALNCIYVFHVGGRDPSTWPSFATPFHVD